jgi:hypothetical protein
VTPSTVPAESPSSPAPTPKRWRCLGYASSASAQGWLHLLGCEGLDALMALPPVKGPDGVCVNPLLFWDYLLERPVLRRCGAHRSKHCPSCATTYRRRVRRVAATGCLDRAAAGGFLGMATFTAPGVPGHRRWVPGGRATELCDCHGAAVGGLGFWNSEAGRRWNHLRTLLRRDFPGAEFFRAVEVQERGALHLHVVFWSPTRVNVHVLQRLALAAGFGCNTRWDAAGADPTRFAGYVSKYVTKATDARGEVPWETVNEYNGELREVKPTFRTWSQSRGFGCTMKAHTDAIAAQRRRYALALAAAGESSAGDSVTAPQPATESRGAAVEGGSA